MAGNAPMRPVNLEQLFIYRSTSKYSTIFPAYYTVFITVTHSSKVVLMKY